MSQDKHYLVFHLKDGIIYDENFRYNEEKK